MDGLARQRYQKLLLYQWFRHVGGVFNIMRYVQGNQVRGGILLCQRWRLYIGWDRLLVRGRFNGTHAVSCKLSQWRRYDGAVRVQGALCGGNACSKCECGMYGCHQW